MMNESSLSRALIYKDARLVAPLVATGIASALFCNLVLYLAWLYWGSKPYMVEGGSAMIWTFIPSLVAFGIAAMLIGTEEESGTLRWLRTLPVSWHQIANSKLFVGVGAFAVVWLFSTLMLGLMSLGWADSQKLRGGFEHPIEFGAATLFYQLLMLLIGYVTVYAIRNPLIALVTTIPVYFCTVVLLAWIFQSLQGGVASGEILRSGILFFAAGTLLAVLALTYVLAARRLTSPEAQHTGSIAANANAGFYRPPVTSDFRQPSPIRSLLWQQVRQTAPIAIPLCVITLMMSTFYLLSGDNPGRRPGFFVITRGLAPLCITLTASWLGVLTFYGDNVRGRTGFFADRGVSPGLVWWTRLVPTLGCFLTLSLILFSVLWLSGHSDPWFSWGDGITLFIGASVLFAFGQLVSQWVRRPILAFLAAPAYAWICMMWMFYFLYEVQNLQIGTFMWMALTIPVLLFASWRLSRKWLEGQDGGRYAMMVVAYTLLAVALPCLLSSTSAVVRMIAQL